MSDPAKLREASEKVLYGLRADDTLKQKILMKAAAGGDTGSRRAFRPLPVFCGVVAALLVAVIALNGLEPAVPEGFSVLGNQKQSCLIRALPKIK